MRYRWVVARRQITLPHLYLKAFYIMNTYKVIVARRQRDDTDI